MPKLGNNVVYDIKDKKLVIQVDLSKELGESKSGKSINIATTSGNKPLGDTEFVMGLNVYKPNR